MGPVAVRQLPAIVNCPDGTIVSPCLAVLTRAEPGPDGEVLTPARLYVLGQTPRGAQRPYLAHKVDLIESRPLGASGAWAAVDVDGNEWGISPSSICLCALPALRYLPDPLPVEWEPYDG